METTVFSISEQRTNIFCIATWNIDGIRNKLENIQVQHLFADVDVLCLNEIKTGLRYGMAGFETFSSHQGTAEHRGGCGVLIRNNLVNQVFDMDCSHSDQVRFRLRLCPGIQFIAIYIPPIDSPYFSLECIVIKC